MGIFSPNKVSEKDDYRLESKYADAEDWQNGLVAKEEEAGAMDEHLAGKRPRLRVFIGLMFFVVAILSYNLYNLQITRADEFKDLAEGNRVRNKTIHADRGVILDARGEVLAKNKGSFDLVIIPFDLPAKEEDRKVTYENLSKLVSIPQSEIETKVNDSERKNSIFDPVVIKENMVREEALVVEAKLYQLQGVTVEKNSVREYVDGPIFAHALGYTGKISASEFKINENDYLPTDYTGKTGIESSYEKDLRGKNGKEQVEVDAQGSVKRVLAQVSPESGYKVGLGLDSGLQRVIYNSLVNSMQNVNAKSGAAVAMNPKTGEILALISMPSYDNNAFAKGIKPEEYAFLLNSEEKPMLNRAISGTFPPGSTAKMITATAGLAEGVIKPETILPAPASITLQNPYDPAVSYTFVDWKKTGFGEINTRDAIAWSSDVFFYQVGGGYKDFQGLGIEKLRSWQEKFGIGKLLGIDIPGEEVGLAPSPEWKKRTIGEDWYVGDTYNLSIGQGYLLTTPMEICSITSTVANGGNIMWPHLANRVLDVNDRVVEEIQPKILKDKVASPEVLQVVREGMRGAVTYGTAQSLSYLPVEAAGKTGTAQFPGSVYGHEHAWFTAFAPYNDPTIAITVLVEKGGEGSTASVPVVYDALNYYFTR